MMGRDIFLTIADDHSRFTWLYLLPSKAEVIMVLRKVFLMVKTIHSSTVKVLRTDNGCECFNTQMTELLKSLGITHQSSCVYTPQQNGVVERRHKHILNIARTLRFQASVPLRFWGECVTTVAYLISRLPTSTLKGRTPYEILHSVPASLTHKFAPRAVPAVFLEYSMVQKGYKMYTLVSRKFIVSRDVVFKEDVYPSRHTIYPISSVFPILDFSPNTSSGSNITVSPQNTIDLSNAQPADPLVSAEIPNLSAASNTSTSPDIESST